MTRTFDSTFKRFAAAAWCGAWLAAALGSPAHAAVMREVALDELVADAAAVVRGVVVRTGTRVVVADGALEPRTHAWLRVEEALVGAFAPGAVVEVSEPGGRYEGVEVVVSGTPHYEVGEEVLVFLARDGAQGGRFRTLQMTQGKFHVVKGRLGERLVTRALEDVSFVRWRKSRVELVPGADSAAAGARPLADLLERVRSLAALRAAGRLRVTGGTR